MDKIERAWQRSQEWILENDGCASEVYYPNISSSNLLSGFRGICNLSNSVKITINQKNGKVDDAKSPDGLFELIKAEMLSSFIIECTLYLEDIYSRLVFHVDQMSKNKYDVELLWFPEEVFISKYSNNKYKAFEIITSYVFSLKDSFNSSKLFIGPEQVKGPFEENSMWVEVL